MLSTLWPSSQIVLISSVCVPNISRVGSLLVSKSRDGNRSRARRKDVRRVLHDQTKWHWAGFVYLPLDSRGTRRSAIGFSSPSARLSISSHARCRPLISVIRCDFSRLGLVGRRHHNGTKVSAPSAPIPISLSSRSRLNYFSDGRGIFRGDACINRKRGAKPAEESASIVRRRGGKGLERRSRDQRVHRNRAILVTLTV
jgi:hypothetical protein